jgi:hypothetical protein
MAGVAGLSAGISVGSLVLAQVVSQPGLSFALFFLFLVGLFALLAVAVITSDQWVQTVWASPERWPRWIQRRRFVRFLLRGIRAALRGMRAALRGMWAALRAMGTTVVAAARAVRAGGARVRRDVTRDALRRAAHTVLDALGLPLDEQEPALEGDPAGALEHALAHPRPRATARHARPEADAEQHTYLPAAYRATRDALEKASRGAKERSAALESSPAPPKPKVAPDPRHISTTVRVVAHHPKAERETDRPQQDPGQLERAFTTRRSRMAREAIKNASHSALVAAMGILPDRGSSAPARSAQ